MISPKEFGVTALPFDYDKWYISYNSQWLDYDTGRL